MLTHKSEMADLFTQVPATRVISAFMQERESFRLMLQQEVKVLILRSVTVDLAQLQQFSAEM